MRYRLLAILLFLVQTICAQVSHQFKNTPLIDAIRTIEQGQTEYTYHSRAIILSGKVILY